MPRPRKNRIAEYAAGLVDEVSFHLGQDLLRQVAASQTLYRDEIAALRAEIKALTREVEGLSRRLAAKRGPKKSAVGRWVPGGPGRPPKDADARVAAFSSRTSRKTKKKRSPRKTKRGS